MTHITNHIISHTPPVGVTTPQGLGQWGEDVVCAHVQEWGWQILDRNWRCSAGELDIIACEYTPAGPVGVAIEVKTRSSTHCGHPLEAITPRKTQRLHRLIAVWAAQHHRHFVRLRVDAMGVVKTPGCAPIFTHVKGI